MNTIRTKEDFLQALEKELVKYFTSQDRREILEDYESFFSEKEVAHESIKTILDELGMPKEIAEELARERGERWQLGSKLPSQYLSKGIRKFLIGLWILVSIVLVVKMQWFYLDSATGSILVIMNIGLFYMIFISTVSRKEHKSKRTDKPTNLLWVMMSFISPLMTFYNLFITRTYLLDATALPIIRELEPSYIGPLFHYQILVAIILSFSLLYFILLKTEGRFFHFNVMFLVGASILFLVILHAQLGNIVTLTAFAAFIRAQLTTYSVIIVLAVIMYGGLRRKGRVS